MAILLTGGTGKTSTRIASLLSAVTPPIPFLLTSRRAPSALPPSLKSSPTIKFDWLDPTTYSNPFNHKFSNPAEKITAIYLVAPDNSPDPGKNMNELIDLAVDKYGVKRFVLLSGTTAKPGGPHVGKVWERLIELEKEGKGISYVVLQATWFMENFSEWQHAASIKNEGKIYTSCQDGKIPFVSAKDIASVAFWALTTPTEKLGGNRFSVRGEELLTYDQVAEKFTNALGRKVTHERLSLEDNTKHLLEIGLQPGYANFLPILEDISAKGAEEHIPDGAVEVATGRKAQNLDDWISEHKHTWD